MVLQHFLSKCSDLLKPALVQLALKVLKTELLVSTVTLAVTLQVNELQLIRSIIGVCGEGGGEKHDLLFNIGKILKALFKLISQRE